MSSPTTPPPAATPRPDASSPPRGPQPVGWLWQAAFALLALGAGALLWRAPVEGSGRPVVDYSVFYAWAEAGKVRSVVLAEGMLEGELVAAEPLDGQRTQAFRTVPPESDPTLLPLLHREKVAVRVSRGSDSVVVGLLVALLPWAAFLGLWLWISRRTQRMMTGAGPLAASKSKGRRFEKSAAVDVTFDHVAGLASAKRDLQEIVQFLREPARFQRLGGKVPRGVLLVGPPGTGKTLLARAVAGESGVPFFSITASEFIEMFVGVGAARVRDLFEEAKKNAPAIIFIDELDAVGRARGAGFGGGHDEREQTLNQLLAEMDGFGRNDLTVVLAATNRPDVLDPALLRPGRFDRRVIIDRPEVGARRAILGVHVRNKPLAPDVDLDSLAQRTPGFSGADLANLVNEAALHATRAGADVIGPADFAEAYDKVVLGDPREGKLGPAERERVAAHEAGHAVVAQFTTGAEPPQRVTIIPRGLALGATQQAPAQDRHLETQPELEARLRVLLGGYAAERLVYGNASSGAENDLKEATQVASKMVAHYGMSDALGPAYYEHHVEHPFLGRRMATDGGLSDATVHTIESETRDLLRRALDAATSVLTQRRAELDRARRALLEQETLEGPELRALLEPPRGQRPEPLAGVVALVR